MASGVERFLKVIDYPGVIPAGALSFSLVVDGGEIVVREVNGRLVLMKVLASGEDELDLGRLAGYAAGRMLREEAVLAWDPDDNQLILWQDVSAQASDDILRRFFEVFATSVDWWMARVRDDRAYQHIPEMMIRP